VLLAAADEVVAVKQSAIETAIQRKM